MTMIVKATVKGQITLPAKWRKGFATDQYLLKEKRGSLEIVPVDLKKLDESGEYTVFDALRDNKGKGIKAADLLKSLKKSI